MESEIEEKLGLGMETEAREDEIEKPIAMVFAGRIGHERLDLLVAGRSKTSTDS